MNKINIFKIAQLSTVIKKVVNEQPVHQQP